MNKNYVKGVIFERKLIKKFSDDGFIALRIAGSGRYSELLPDVVVMKDGVVIAFECKKTKKDKVYLSKDFENFKKFKEITNIKCFFAIKFPRKKVRFYDIEKIKKKRIDLNEPFITYEDLMTQRISVTISSTSTLNLRTDVP